MKNRENKAIRLLLAVILLLSISITAFAIGDDNIDSGSGSMGSGTSSNYWSSGHDGVRVTVIDASGNPIGISIDYTNILPSIHTIHFGNTSKLDYLNGASLTPMHGDYYYINPNPPLPRIVSDGSGNASLQAIKSYFCSEGAAQMIAGDYGIPFDLLISGTYKVFLEPIVYITYNGNKIAMTAHEAALFDQEVNGDLKIKFASLTHQNLPLAMYLERPDLNLPAYNGATSGYRPNADILSSLGMGIISYTDTPDEPFTPPEPGSADYDYRINTEVITAVTLNAFDEINPDAPAMVTFNINGGGTYVVSNIVIPEGGSQLVWCKWRTPAIDQTITITVSASRGYLSENIITARVGDLNRNPPPDPKATDRNDSFSIPAIPSKTQKTSETWSVWRAIWHPDWEWESDWRWVSNWVYYSDGMGDGGWYDYGYWHDFGQWVDNGWYDFFTDVYTASLNGSSVITSDEKVPTAIGKLTKSGYGINNKVTANFTTNAPSSHVTGAQNAISYFPEFRYNTYWRLLDLISGGYSPLLEFKQNSFSTYSQRAHFIPVWFPDGEYKVYTWLIDAWTPSGMLSMNLHDYVTIKGSMFDDWFTNRE